MAKSSLSRKEREKLRHKEEILGAALKLFSKKGFHNVSMQDVAEKSEFSVGTLYNFFESKEALFSELIKSCAHRVSCVLFPILDADEDEAKKILKYIRAYKQIIRENSQAIRLYVSQNREFALSSHPNLDREITKIDELILKKLSDVFSSGIHKGVFRALDPWIVALSLSAAIKSFIFWAVENPDKKSIEESISGIKDLFFSGIVKPASIENGS